MTERRSLAEDALFLLNEFTVKLLKILADLMITADPTILDRRDALAAIGRLLSLLSEKADSILYCYNTASTAENLEQVNAPKA
jgi:hypothetical protein